MILRFKHACIALGLVSFHLFAAVPSSLAALETASSGRLGVFALDTSNNNSVQYRADERFPMDSTFKLMLVGAILKKSMSDATLLQQRITYSTHDFAGYSPITAQHVAQGMTIAELCAAALDYSDNTAANLLLKQIGGPAALNVFARSMGDTQFHLDRTEPALNSNIPGDLRDTTTPKAMTLSLQKLALGNVLAAAQREQLQTWLKANTTGDQRIRAAMPKSWVVGDKTGTGGYGTTNDVAIIWPPHCAPVLMTVYYTQISQDAVANSEVVVAAAREALQGLASRDRCLQGS